MNIEQRLKDLKIDLPACPKPVGSYKPVIVANRTAYLSGQIARRSDGVIIAGKVGADLSLEQGQEAARVAVLNILSITQNLIGFEKMDRFIRLVGYVQAASNFYEISQVMNAASDLMVEIFGEKGIHARTAVGMASLPLNSAVEIEATLLLK